MEIPSPSRPVTRYRDLPRAQALVILAALFLAVAACLFLSVGPPPTLGAAVEGHGDVALYDAVVQRLHAGENYYDVLGSELLSHGFPVSSVFNWRTPLHLELVAHLPSLAWARALLLLGAIVTIGIAAAAACRNRHYALAYLQSVLLALSFVTVMPFVLFGEVWAGVCIALSVASYALGWRLRRPFGRISRALFPRAGAALRADRSRPCIWRTPPPRGVDMAGRNRLLCDLSWAARTSGFVARRAL